MESIGQSSEPWIQPATDVMPVVLQPELEVQEPQNRILRRAHQAMMVGVRSVQTAVVMAEIFPGTNEIARYGTLGYVQLETGNPVLSAAAFGVATLAVEGSGALAMSGLMESRGTQRMLGWFDRKTGGRLRRTEDESSRVTPAVEAGIALSLGTPAVLAVRQAEDPTRTIHENRKHGMAVASIMSAYLAVEAFAASAVTKAMDIHNSWESTGVTVAGAIGLTAAGSWLHKRIKGWRESRRSE